MIGYVTLGTNDLERAARELVPASGLAGMRAVLPDLTQLYDQFKDGDRLEIDFRTGQMVLNGEQAYQAEPFSQVQMDIYQAGDLFAYGKSLA